METVANGRRLLTASQGRARRLLAGATKAIEDAEKRWATLVWEFDCAAVSREVELTPEALR